VSQNAAEHPLRVGIVGVDNGHAHAFAHILNGWDRNSPQPFRFSKEGGDDSAAFLWTDGIWLHEKYAPTALNRKHVQVTRIFGEEREQAMAIAAACGIAHVAETPDDACEDVDLVLVLSDAGNDHARHAAPAFARGLPVFIDKPMSTSLEQARELFASARAGCSPVFSASALKFSPRFNAAQRELTALVGELRAVHVQCPVDMQSYAIHGLEIINIFLGHDVESLMSMRSPGHDVALLRFNDGRSAVLEHIDIPGHLRYNVILHGTMGVHRLSYDGIATVFIALLGKIVAFARSRTPPVQEAETLALLGLFERIRAPEFIATPRDV